MDAGYTRAYCCSLVGCFDDTAEQQQSIDSDQLLEQTEHACSVSGSSANLTWNPQEAYRSTIKMDTTTSTSLWGARQSVGQSS